MDEIEVQVSRRCDQCNGDGTQDANRSACPLCRGSGRISAVIGIAELARLLGDHERLRLTETI